MSDIADLQKRAIQIRDMYDALSTAQGRPLWGPKERAMGFVTDLGELMELVMAKENLRPGDNVDEKLAHELADCLWSILSLADYYAIDLDRAFGVTMDHLQQRIAEANG